MKPVTGTAAAPNAAPLPRSPAASQDAAVTPYEERLAESVSAALDEGGQFFMGASDVHQALRRIAKTLDQLGIPYAVAGGMALVAHGYNRFTDDIDVIVSRDALERIHEELDGRGWVRPFSQSKNLRDTYTGVRIEFLISGDYPGDGKPKPVQFPLPEQVSVEVEGIKYVGLTTLIELKLASYMTGKARSKDLGDVEELIKTLKPPREFAAELNPYVACLFLEKWDEING